MSLRPGARQARWVPIALLVLAAALVATPLGLSFSRGIASNGQGAAKAPPGDFETFGCTACHGAALKFPPVDNAALSWTVQDAEGNGLNGPYHPDTAYTITIRLNETNAPQQANHAGFNLRASAGKLEGIAGQSQAATDNKQATHVDPTRTSWSVKWTAPESGPVAFSLFVNDVDGDGAPSLTDEVRWVQFGFTDASGAVLGAVVEEEVEFGIRLQQYWIGLIALAGMLFVMVASFVYLKFVNPHNTDPKDR